MSVNASLDLPSNIALVHEWFTPRSTGGAENVVEVIDDLLTEIASQPELFSLVNEENLHENSWLFQRKVKTPLAARWLLLITSGYPSKSSCSIAKGKRGKYC